MGFILGLLLFILVFYYTGGTDLLVVLSGVNISYILVAFLSQLLVIFLCTLRLKTILSFLDYNLEFSKVLKILIAGMGINQLTPIVRAGGEPVKMYYLSKNNVPATKSSASVIIEISSELISVYATLFLLVIFLSSMKYLAPKYLHICIPLVAVFAVAFIFIFRFLLKEENIRKFIRYILRFFKTKKKISSNDFTQSLRTLFKNRSLQLKIFSMSFLVRFFELLRIYFLLQAINYPTIFFLVLSIWVLQYLFSMVPWLPGGLGLIEGGTISGLVLLGLPIYISSSLILLDRVLSFWLPIFLGFLALYFLKKEFSNQELFKI